MNDQNINITISGQSSPEKDAISFLIADFLSHTGFDVAIDLPPDVAEDQIMYQFEEKLDNFCDSGAQIIIDAR